MSGVAGRYASALFELALEENALDNVEKGVDDMRAALIGSKDLRRLVRSPLYDAEEQERALDAVMDRIGVTGLTANFVKLTARNRRLFALHGMLEAFRTMLSKHRGETTAVVTSAEPLSDTHVATLKKVLAGKAGGAIKLETHVDASLIGGLIVRLGSRMIDTSVKTRLAGLSAAMKEAA